MRKVVLIYIERKKGFHTMWNPLLIVKRKKNDCKRNHAVQKKLTICIIFNAEKMIHSFIRV